MSPFDELRLARLEAQVDELRSQLEIREVLGLYGFTADLGHEESYARLWTEDGTYDLDDAKVEGRPGLYQVVADPDGLHKQRVENRSMHVPANVVVGIDGDTAWAEAYSLVIVRRDAANGGRYDEGYTVLTAGYNHFDFERIDGRWRIRRRIRRSVGGDVWGGDVMTRFADKHPDGSRATT